MPAYQTYSYQALLYTFEACFAKPQGPVVFLPRQHSQHTRRSLERRPRHGAADLRCCSANREAAPSTARSRAELSAATRLLLDQCSPRFERSRSTEISLLNSFFTFKVMFDLYFEV